MIRVLVADDQSLMRKSLSALLSRVPEIDIVGEARDGKEAVDLATDLKPDVVLMDIQMPRLDGLGATKEIGQRRLTSRVLIVTQSLDEMLVRTALEYGAFGYMSKTDLFDELVPALQAVHTREAYFSKTILRQYPQAIISPRRDLVWRYDWRDPEWAKLRDRLERSLADCRAGTKRGRLVCDDSINLRAQISERRAITSQLLSQRHNRQAYPSH